MEFDGAFCKIFKLLLDRFFSFFRKTQKIGTENDPSKKIGVTERPRSLNPRKVIAIAICPIIVHFTTQRARSMHDVACEFRTQERCAETIGLLPLLPLVKLLDRFGRFPMPCSRSFLVFPFRTFLQLRNSRDRSRPRFLLVTRHKTASESGRGHRSRTLISLPGSFFQLPSYKNVLPVFVAFLRVFIFTLVF